MEIGVEEGVKAEAFKQKPHPVGFDSVVWVSLAQEKRTPQREHAQLSQSSEENAHPAHGDRSEGAGCELLQQCKQTVQNQHT